MDVSAQTPNPVSLLGLLGSGVPKVRVNSWYTPIMETWSMAQCLEFLGYSDVTQTEIASRTVTMLNKQGASSIRKFIIGRLKSHILGLGKDCYRNEIYPVFNSFIDSLQRDEILEALDSSKSWYDGNPNFVAIGTVEVIRFALLYHLEKSIAGHFPNIEGRNVNLPHLARYTAVIQARSATPISVERLREFIALNTNPKRTSANPIIDNSNSSPEFQVSSTTETVSESTSEISSVPINVPGRKEYPPINNCNRRVRIIDETVINGLLQGNFGKCPIEGFNLNINNERVLEKHVQERLAAEFGGGHHTVDIGIIDILTPTMVCELKNWDSWLKALGQILAYSYYFPERQKRIHFFGPCPNNWKVYSIYVILSKYNIVMSCEHY